MVRSVPRLLSTGVSLIVVGIGVAACGHTQAPANVSPRTSAAQAATLAIEQARADSARHRFTPADVDFVTGMIHHHTQAVLIAGWAPTHGASPSLQALCARIQVGQRDEIRFMQNWLADRHQTVPDADTSHFMMPGMSDMMPSMPGMLTYDQLVELNQASGTDFDRLFLSDMIQHHKGAITMVEQLFATNGALQDDVVFKLASDIHADQVTEIGRMSAMLDALPSGGTHP